MSQAPPTGRYVEQVMGLPISLALRGAHTEDRAAHDAWSRVVEELREVDRVFSTYRSESPVSRLARDEITLDDCPPEVAEVLALGEAARVQSGGAFDVRWPDPDGVVVLDPSGVVKGWAVERAARHLLDLADTDHCLSAGGDMVCHTASPTGDPWRIGVEHPHDPARLVAVVPLRRGAVATSALTHRGAHIVDPRTGRTPHALASVTVLAASLTWADVDATAAFVLGQDAPAWLTGRGRSGVLVWADGRVETYAETQHSAVAAGSSNVGLSARTV